MNLSIKVVRDMQGVIFNYQIEQDSILEKFNISASLYDFLGASRNISSHFSERDKAQDKLQEIITEHTGQPDYLLDLIFYEMVSDFEKYKPERNEEIVFHYCEMAEIGLNKLLKYSDSLICCVPAANDDVY